MFYNYTATDINGEKISMEEYRGKVVLVVNTASKCGLTFQFGEMEKIYRALQEKGFEILGFPCGQFHDQEFKDNQAILEFCVTKFDVTFKMFEKIDVNGENEHPLYTFLKAEQKGRWGTKIKWNFTKFLIDRDGNVIKRYAPTTMPLQIKSDITRLLQNKSL